MKTPVLLPLFFMLIGSVSAREDAWKWLMPVPASLELKEGKFRLDPEFGVSVVGDPDSRIFPEATRFLRRLDGRTGLFFDQAFVTPESEPARGLEIQVQRPGEVVLGEDESYHLAVSEERIQIKATTDLGALHGLETLLQLLSADEDGYYFPQISVEDQPRFPWRGLMIDSARHFMPLDMIKRNLDGMAAVKLNVMHWHLTEDQGFRVESKTYPRLHELGSDGLYYTQDEVREIIAYADQRGIRVYPEFDVPGHATSWLVGHPEIGSAPGPYEIERAWGIFDPTLDPTNEATYELLEGFFGEMAALFPDPYFHIGGDEVTGKHWEANERIQAFMLDNGIEDMHGLQSYFNQRILKILTPLGKRMVGWDEILQPGMPTDIVIHSWRGRDSMEAAAKGGYQSILSNGYYIDLMQPASFHYLNDPLLADNQLTEAQQAMVLGGEATMWSEHVTPETVDSRIWPRLAAIAERLWSNGTVNDVDDMYRRLDYVSIQLEELGLTHIKNREMMMRRLVGNEGVESVRVLADVVEPLKIYRRNADNSYRSYSPYTLLPDIAIADAIDARRFRSAVERYLETGDADSEATVYAFLEKWKANHSAYLKLVQGSPALRETASLSQALERIAELGLRSLAGESLPANAKALLEEARKPVAKVELQVVDAIESLIER